MKKEAREETEERLEVQFFKRTVPETNCQK